MMLRCRPASACPPRALVYTGRQNAQDLLTWPVDLKEEQLCCHPHTFPGRCRLPGILACFCINKSRPCFTPGAFMISLTNARKTGSRLMYGCSFSGAPEVSPARSPQEKAHVPLISISGLPTVGRLSGRLRKQGWRWLSCLTREISTELLPGYSRRRLGPLCLISLPAGIYRTLFVMSSHFFFLFFWSI